MMYEQLKTLTETLLKENADYTDTREIYSEGMKYTHHTIWKDDEMIEIIYDDEGYLDKIKVLTGKR